MIASMLVFLNFDGLGFFFKYHSTTVAWRVLVQFNKSNALNGATSSYHYIWLEAQVFGEQGFSQGKRLLNALSFFPTFITFTMAKNPHPPYFDLVFDDSLCLKSVEHSSAKNEDGLNETFHTYIAIFHEVISDLWLRDVCR